MYSLYDFYEDRREGGRNHSSRGANGNYADEYYASPAGNCTHARGHRFVYPVGAVPPPRRSQTCVTTHHQQLTVHQTNFWGNFCHVVSQFLATRLINGSLAVTRSTRIVSKHADILGPRSSYSTCPEGWEFPCGIKRSSLRNWTNRNNSFHSIWRALFNL